MVVDSSTRTSNHLSPSISTNLIPEHFPILDVQLKRQGERLCCNRTIGMNFSAFFEWHKTDRDACFNGCIGAIRKSLTAVGLCHCHISVTYECLAYFLHDSVYN